MEYKCVRNRTKGAITVPHADPTVPAIEVGRYAAVWIRNWNAWGDENPDAYGLWEAVADNKLTVTTLKRRPVPMKYPPNDLQPARGAEKGAMVELVTTDDEDRAMDIINEPATRVGTPRRSVDTDYLSKHHSKLLEGAIWMWENNPTVELPNKTARKKAAQERLHEIERLLS